MPNNVLRIEDIYMKKRYEAKGIQRKKIIILRDIIIANQGNGRKKHINLDM